MASLYVLYQWTGITMYCISELASLYVLNQWTGIIVHTVSVNCNHCTYCISELASLYVLLSVNWHHCTYYISELTSLYVLYQCVISSQIPVQPLQEHLASIYLWTLCHVDSYLRSTNASVWLVIVLSPLKASLSSRKSKILQIPTRFLCCHLYGRIICR